MMPFVRSLLLEEGNRRIFVNMVGLTEGGKLLTIYVSNLKCSEDYVCKNLTTVSILCLLQTFATSKQVSLVIIVWSIFYKIVAGSIPSKRVSMWLEPSVRVKTTFSQRSACSRGLFPGTPVSSKKESWHDGFRDTSSP